MKIDKLSEKNLEVLAKTLFPGSKIYTQVRIKVGTRAMIIDVVVETGEDTFFFEFDGPTHYQQTKTQERDLILFDYCIDNEIYLVRFPYFAQYNQDAASYFTHNIVERYQLDSRNFECEYAWGFYDKKIIYPSDFNSFGWSIFYNWYTQQTTRNKLAVRSRLVENPYLTIGLDWRDVKTKSLFVLD